MNYVTTQIPKSANRVIHCQRSGVPLLEVSSLCSNGWALISQSTFSCLVHPVYDLPLGKAVRKLELQLTEAERLEWEIPLVLIREVALSMSSIMYSLGAMWTPTDEAIANGRNIESSLPDQRTVVGSAARLLDLASWYHHETSKRINFPLWRPSKQAGNLNWHGFPAWLDACFEVREDWETGVRKAENKALLKATSETLLEVSLATMYKRIDTKKVWNWIELQASQHADKYSAGRRETLRTLFMTGDVSPENWLPDDCDDLIEMVIDTCDLGNDITSYIRNRVSTIRAAVNDFYGNFTLIGSASADSDGGLELSHAEKSAQTSLFGEYESKLAGLTELPPKPTAEQYPHKILLLKAQAEWNILSRLFSSRNKATQAK